MSETNIKNGVGRPNKKGLDYFAHLVKHSDEENIIFQQFGCIGYTVYYSIREKITENGYYYELTDRKKLLLCSQFHIEISDFNKIISFAIDLELFDKALFEKYGVLTSERLQIDYIFSASRRTQIDFITEYCLISDTVLYREFSDSKVLEKITYYSICDNNNSISDNSNSQSKVKYSKSNSESIEKEIKKEKASAKENGKGYERECAERENKEKPQIDVSELSDEEYKALFHQ